jgi:hypothetical protein
MEKELVDLPLSDDSQLSIQRHMCDTVGPMRTICCTKNRNRIWVLVSIDYNCQVPGRLKRGGCDLLAGPVVNVCGIVGRDGGGSDVEWESYLGSSKRLVCST